MSSYLRRTYNKAWHFELTFYGLAHLFPNVRPYSISFGYWLQIFSNEAQSQTAPAMLENPGIPLIFRIPTHDGTKIDYQPLKPSEIRLFILDPGSSTDALSGRIQQSSWGTDYEALSYVWGDVQDSTTMCIDGHTVSVTRSLGTALDHLRYPGRSRKLWIDYICINQDVVERSQQVAKMGLIYENSKSVLIWLGPSTLYSPVGMDIIRYFADAEKPQDRPVWQTYPSRKLTKGCKMC
ncbi:heterokaryon incompatibility protein-domain-containing protein [Fusarium oxysporum]|nr:heterokaryon incompatibility protein-domain-containing protein [Fusarium oxysporum]